MYLRLANANFTVNLGTMTSLSKSWSVSYTTTSNITRTNCPSFVSYNESTLKGTLTATVTLATGATFNSVTVTSGTAGTPTTSISGQVVTITVPNVASNIALNIVATGGSAPVAPTNYTFTLNPTPTSATVTLSATGYSTVSGTGSKSITVANGTKVNWTVSASGYTTRTGNWTANGSNESKSVTLNGIIVDGNTTWYIDHRNNGGRFTSSVNIAGRGWCHVPGTAAYNTYVGKPVNTIGFFTNLASQNVTISKVIEKGGEADMTEIATVTLTNPSGTTKNFCSVSFPTVTLADKECLAVYTQTDADIQFYYLASSGPVTDANGINDGNFYGRVPKVYGAGSAWTNYNDGLCLGMSVGYNSEIA